MAIIFGSYYRDNLVRINSRTKDFAPQLDAPFVSPQAQGSGKDFARILADLEQKSPRKAEDYGRSSSSHTSFSLGAVLRGNEPSMPAIKEAVLTNLEEKEKRSPLYSPGLASTPTAHFADSYLRARLALPNTLGALESVKGVAESVKVPAPLSENSPQNILQTLFPKLSQNESHIPAVPTIKSAKRVTVSEKNSDSEQPVSFSKNEIKKIIATAGRLHGVDPNLPLAIAEAESSFRPQAVSQDGHESKGVFQLLDSTARDMLGHLDVKDKYDPFDPLLNAHLGVGYLRRLLDLFSSETSLGQNTKTRVAKSAADLEKLAVAAFNAGEGAVARAQAKADARGKDPTDFFAVEAYLPESTRAYVKRVNQLRASLEKEKDEGEVS